MTVHIGQYPMADFHTRIWAVRRTSDTTVLSQVVILTLFSQLWHFFCFGVLLLAVTMRSKKIKREKKRSYKRKRKICWCTLLCGKPLPVKTRRRHYAQLSKAENDSRRRSESLDPLMEEALEDVDLSDSVLLTMSDSGSGIDIDEEIDMNSENSISGDNFAGGSTPNEDCVSSTGSDHDCSSSEGGSEGHGDGGRIDEDEDEDGLEREFEAWMKFDEDEEFRALADDDERLRAFNEMMGWDSERMADEWASRESNHTDHDFTSAHILRIRS